MPVDGPHYDSFGYVREAMYLNHIHLLSCPLMPPPQPVFVTFPLLVCVCVPVSLTKVGYRDMGTLQMAIQLMETSALPLPIPPGGVEPQESPLLP